MSGNHEAQIIISSDEEEQPPAVVSTDVLNALRTIPQNCGICAPSAFIPMSLQCFDNVGWASGRAPGLYKLH